MFPLDLRPRGIAVLRRAPLYSENKGLSEMARPPLLQRIFLFFCLRLAEIAAESAEDAGEVEDPPRADGARVPVPAGFRALLAPFQASIVARACRTTIFTSLVH